MVRSRVAIALALLAAASMPVMSSAQVTTTYTYDGQGQVRTVTRPANAVRPAQSTTYTYDAAGNRTALTLGFPDAPQVANAAIAAPYNTATALALPITGSFTSIGFPAAPAHGTLSLTGATVIYSPTAGYVGSDSFTYNAVGAGGPSSTATVSVVVGAPVAPTVANTGLTATYNASGSVVLPVSGLYTSIGFRARLLTGTLGLTGSTVTYYPVAGYYGADSFTYNATGPGGTSASATVGVTVAQPPPPSVANADFTFNFPSSGVLTLPVSGYYSSIAFPTAPTKGTLVLNGATVTFIPYGDRIGADGFTYTATGPGGTSAPATVSVYIVPPAVPTAGNVSAVVPYNTAKTIPLAITGAYYTTYIYTNPSHGILSNYTSSFIYTPNPGYSGPDSFAYMVQNAAGSSGVATGSITVEAPPNAPQPTPQPDTATVHSQNTVTISPLANDSDPSGYPLTIIGAVSNGGGTVSIINNGTQIRFNAPTVATRGNKTVTLTYTVSNGHGGTASSTISVVVTTEYNDF